LKPLRQKKVLGIVIGERSMLAAEVIAGGDRPQVRRLAEMVYPEGITLSEPAELARAVVHFLKDNQFGTRAAVIGIPLKWIVVKPKEVPPADDETVAQLLRLEAEQEFSTELKDLVYDFAGDSVTAGKNRTVLLAATSKKHIDAIETLCEGARLQVLAITPSALALGTMTGAGSQSDVLVLSVGSAGSELSSQRQSSAMAIRSLRPAMPQAPFVSELRRAVSTLPTVEGGREMVLWDGAGMDADNLRKQLGVNIRAGELGALGVDASQTGVNGQGAKFAAAVALGLSAIGDSCPAIDFLHSRLAPPDQHKIPRWSYLAVAAAVLLIVLGVFAYNDLNDQQALVDAAQAKIDKQKPQVTAAQDFVAKATTAQYWHAGDPRYLYCMRDLEQLIPRDNQTYAISWEIRAQTPPLNAPANQNSAAAPPSADSERALLVTLQGHTPNMESVTTLVDLMHHSPDKFKDVNIGSQQKVGRTNEWSFTISFGYLAPESAGSTSSGSNASGSNSSGGSAPR
jgi:hypothetical protein